MSRSYGPQSYDIHTDGGGEGLKIDLETIYLLFFFADGGGEGHKIGHFFWMS